MDYRSLIGDLYTHTQFQIPLLLTDPIHFNCKSSRITHDRGITPPENVTETGPQPPAPPKETLFDKLCKVESRIKKIEKSSKQEAFVEALSDIEYRMRKMEKKEKKLLQNSENRVS
jgi:hypothetical protein